MLPPRGSPPRLRHFSSLSAVRSSAFSAFLDFFFFSPFSVLFFPTLTATNKKGGLSPAFSHLAKLEHRLSGIRIEDQDIGSRFREIQHVGYRPRNSVEGMVPNPSQPPVIFNKPDRRGLVGQCAIHEV